MKEGIGARCADRIDSAAQAKPKKLLMQGQLVFVCSIALYSSILDCAVAKTVTR